MIEWQKMLEVGGALLSTTAGLWLLEKIVSTWSKASDNKRLEEEAERTREHEERQNYRSQIHDDYMMLREEIKKIEAQLRVCEDERAKDRAELYRLREHLQLIQFQLDEKE